MSLLNEFNSTSPVSNTSGTVAIPLLLTFRVIASLNGPRTVTIDNSSNKVQLEATIGWAANAAETTVEFAILRDNPNTGTVIFTTRQSGEAGSDANQNTTFEHIDLPKTTGDVLYYLEARVVTGSATVIGPVTFSGAEILPNP
ncbi:hypothetical protein [Niallia nealsonii]|uniref:Uncharacterized protein n=1 Tax=Niallia nealsonii TaxID=115979 RepID=A0A2N0Z4M1_9BACI|nr:hypothetical protein [Niallia nealsonii]PKG24456.1 hypothetical protein CWS01_06540 [Niallia nealsonii]